MTHEDQKFRALVEAVSQIIWTCNATGTFLEDSPSWRKFTGQTVEEWKNSPWDVVHIDDVDSIKKILEHHLKHKTLYESEFRLKHNSGEWHWVQAKAIPILGDDGEIDSWLGMTLDINQRKIAEIKLEESRQQFRELTARTNQAIEEVSKRIATEVHDQLGGNLAAVKHDLERITQKLADQPDAPLIRELTNDIFVTQQLVEMVIGLAKSISSELHSSELEFLGLISALKSEVIKFQERYDISYEFESNILDSSLTKDQETAVFRVFQELLRNILQHSNATELHISINEKDDCFVMKVKDNGRGITETQKNSPKSLGLLGMKERMNIVGGHLEIQGFENVGTVSIVSIYLGKGKIVRF